MHAEKEAQEEIDVRDEKEEEIAAQ